MWLVIFQSFYYLKVYKGKTYKSGEKYKKMCRWNYCFLKTSFVKKNILHFTLKTAICINRTFWNRFSNLPNKLIQYTFLL